MTVVAGELAIMAMYHINLGYPLAGPDSLLTLNGVDVTGEAIGRDGVFTRPAGAGTASARLSRGQDGPAFTVDFDTAALPVFQTLRNAADGVNLVCLEPASHERLPRAELRERGDLRPLPRGESRAFGVTMHFSG